MDLDLATLHGWLKTIWVVWFFVLFLGILVWVLRPGSRQRAQEHAAIPFRNDPN